MRDVVVDTEVVKDALWLACRAPSLHNSQPWRWIIEPRAVQLFLDTERAPRHTDTTGREALISCGAVLDHFRVAMAAAGWLANVDRFPNPNNRDHLASVDFSAMDYVTDGHRDRAAAILSRHTDRLPFAAPRDWKSFVNRLADNVDNRAVRVDALAEEAGAELAEASRLTASLRLYDSPYHAELVGWTSGSAAGEGIPAGALLSAAESERVEVGRDFPVTHHAERRSQLDDDHARILVLSTYDDTRDSYLRCGEALSAVLLDAQMAQLATCTLTHITEVPASRDIVAALVGGQAIPQIVIRVGGQPTGDDVLPPTPRRPLDEVVEIRN